MFLLYIYRYVCAIAMEIYKTEHPAQFKPNQSDSDRFETIRIESRQEQNLDSESTELRHLTLPMGSVLGASPRDESSPLFLCLFV